jgi:hypothetical protein
MRDCA